MILINNKEKKYRIEGYGGYSGVALELPSHWDLIHFAENYEDADDPASMILVRNNLIADANSFWLQALYQKGTGGRVLADEKILLACGSVRR